MASEMSLVASTSKNLNPGEASVVLVQEHPLLNSLVIRKIFKYLESTADFSTLKIVRLVCTLWRNESLSWWRKTATLCLTQNRRKTNASSGNCSCIPCQLRKCNHGFYNLAEKPFHNYKFENTALDVSFVFKRGTTSNALWNFVGPQIRQLTLSKIQLCSGTFDSLSDPASFMFFISGYMPNLENLVINNLLFVRNDNLTHHTNLAKIPQHSSVKSLRLQYPFGKLSIDNFPNLECLNLEKCSANDIDNLLKKGNFTADVNTKLKRLEFQCYMNGNGHNRVNSTEGFQWRKFPDLEHVSLGLVRCLGQPRLIDYLQIFVNYNCTKCLKVLEIFEFPFTRPTELAPSAVGMEKAMENINEIRLLGSVVRDLRFLGWTHNLKVLHMDLFGIEKRKELKENATTWFAQRIYYLSVESLVQGLQDVLVPKLEYLQMNCALQAESLKNLGSCMPNLKTLKTVLIADSVSVISEQWPLLEHLVGLHGSKVVDKDIFRADDKGLLKLKCLKSFRLDACCNEGLLTDWAVDSGFLKMKSLVDLQLCVSSQFSDKAEKTLKNHVPRARVIRNYKENKDHVNWECCEIMEFIQYFQENFERVINQRRY